MEAGSGLSARGERREAAGLTWAKSLGAVAGLGGGLGLIYVAGGLAVMYQLHNANLPAFAIAWQLPRELLIAYAVRVLGWSLLIGAASAAILGGVVAFTRVRRSVILGLALGAAIFSIGVGFVLTGRSGLSNVIVCRKNQLAPVYGQFVARTSDRTYIGQPHSTKVRHARILSMPNDTLDAILIGGEELVGNTEGTEPKQVCDHWETRPTGQDH